MDTTIWKTIPGLDGLYDASDTGLIRTRHKHAVKEAMKRGANDRIIRPKLDKDCYLTVSLYINSEERITRRINQIIALTFIPNPENKKIADHINGVRWDNRVENLRWFTNGENQKAAYDYGRKVNRGRSVSQYDLDGRFIKSFRVIMDVEKDGFLSKNVNKVILGQRRTHGGFIWKENIASPETA